MKTVRSISRRTAPQAVTKESEDLRQDKELEGPGRVMSSEGNTPRSDVEHPPGYVNGRLFSKQGLPEVLMTDFDVRAYTRRARGKHNIGEGPFELSAAAGRDLAFIWRLETSALEKTRAVLSSWTSRESRVTAFIATWAVERFWMARAIRDVLDAAGVPRQARNKPTLRIRISAKQVERVLPLVRPITGGIIGEPVTAGHIARLAIQEGALQSAYAALRPRVGAAVRAVFDHVAERRDDILNFVRLEAVTRMNRSRADTGVARLHLMPSWSPLRVVGVPDPDETAALASIFADPLSMTSLYQSDAVIGNTFRCPVLPSVSQVKQARASASRNH